MERRARPPFERGGDGAIVAGVAAGLARHLEIDPVKVRLAFAALTVAGGAGPLLYAAFWMVVPRGAGATTPPLIDRVQLPAIGALVVGGLLLAHELGLTPIDPGLWPILVVGAGLAVVWRQADEASRTRWLGVTDEGWVRRLRVAGGVGLLIAGLGAFLASNHELQAAREGLAAIVVVVVGLALVLAPWWWSLVHDVAAERRERIRSQERAEMAAHLHDSVLQTLALIQRRADAPAEVQRLARRQERELRAWLFAQRDMTGALTLAAAVEAAAAEVEVDHGVPIEVVTVGDCDLDARLDAMVRAAREAMVNAAKFAAVDHVDVFVEVEDGEVAVFVRDTGVGFDPTAVADDRRGVAESIVGRMARHGGSASVRSALGEGAEVELRMSRSVV